MSNEKKILSKSATPLNDEVDRKLQRQKQIAEALQEIIGMVERNEVAQISVAAVTHNGAACTAVVSDQAGFITMVGALEMCKLEVVTSCAPELGEEVTH